MAIGIIAIYVVIAIFLNKFNKLVYGKGTPMCFIPFANVYLLGKLAVNKMVGWALIIGFFLTGRLTITVNNYETVYRFLPENISHIFFKIEGLIILALLIYAVVRYFEIKISKNESSNQGESK